MASIHPLDRWRSSLERAEILGTACWREKADSMWTNPQQEWGASEILLARCVLHLEGDEVEEALPYLYGDLDDAEDDDGDAPDPELLARWREPIAPLLAGAEIRRERPARLWGIGTRTDSMIDPYNGYAAESFHPGWALVTQDAMHDYCGPLRIPLGLVPQEDVSRLAPLLIANHHADWGFTGRDTELPFSGLSGHDVALYRVLLAVTGVSHEVLELSDDRLLAMHPRHPEGGWGIEEVRALLE